VKRLLIVLAVLLIPAALVAHDTWLIPAAFTTTPGAPVRVKLATGEAFPASETAVAPERVARFTLRTKSGVRPVEGFRVDGTFLVADVTPPEPGHAIVVAETKARAFELEPKVFNEYLREEELKTIMDARKAKGQWNAPGRERYRKIAKTILCVGETLDKGYEQPEGLWLEIVPAKSTCNLRWRDMLVVQVLFEGKPLPRVAVAAGYEGATGHEYPFWTRTNANGLAKFQFNKTGTWFIRTLHMVPAKDDPEADWQSAFSTLTLEVKP